MPLDTTHQTRAFCLPTEIERLNNVALGYWPDRDGRKLTTAQRKAKALESYALALAVADNPDATQGDLDQIDWQEICEALAAFVPKPPRPLIIEIDPESATMCLANGETVRKSEFEGDVMDCTTSGDCQGACEFVLDQIGVDFCIVAKDANGKYENRAATDAEKQATCEAIYFESETDFSDVRMAEIYLVWQAAADVEAECGECA